MKKRFIWGAMLFIAVLGGVLSARAAQTVALDAIGLETAFPDGWTVVTRETVAERAHLFPDETPEGALARLEREEVYAVAFSPGGDATMRVIASQSDDRVRQYYDIERYTAAMRKSLLESMLDRSNWAALGYRYSDGEWTNKEGRGRLLHLTYSIREGEEVTARGKQVYTVRNGWAFTLDVQAQGRRLEADEDKAFEALVAATVFPVSADMPLFPVGLALTGVVPEETYSASVSLRGETTKGATVSAWLLADTVDEPMLMGEVTANNSGVFRLDFTIPEKGEWRLYMKAELEGYAATEEARWISYDPRRLPITFTSYPTGDVYDTQIFISGKTISGVTIQCMEGETNKTVKTGSDGSFSIRLDRAIGGERTVILSFTKKDFDNRRVEVEFTRKWTQADYAKQLDEQVKSLSYENLTTRAEEFIGRIVRYKGEVIAVSGTEEQAFVEVGVTRDKSGRWTERIIAAAGASDPLPEVGDSVTVYFEVTGEFYTFPEATEDGEGTEVEVPSVKMLTFLKDS